MFEIVRWSARTYYMYVLLFKIAKFYGEKSNSLAARVTDNNIGTQKLCFDFFHF